MADSVDTLAGATGLQREDLLQLWERTRENQVRLDGCARHTFEPLTESTSSLFTRKYRCSACGGTVYANEHHWYLRGLQHGAVRER